MKRETVLAVRRRMARNYAKLLKLLAASAAVALVAGCDIIDEGSEGDTYIVVTNVVVTPAPIEIQTGNGSPVTFGDGNDVSSEVSDDHTDNSNNSDNRDTIAPAPADEEL